MSSVWLFPVGIMPKLTLFCTLSVMPDNDALFLVVGVSAVTEVVAVDLPGLVVMSSVRTTLGPVLGLLVLPRGRPLPRAGFLPPFFTMV